MVKIEVDLQKEVVDFLRKFCDLTGENLDAFVENSLEKTVESMVKGEAIFDTYWSTTARVIRANGLAKII